MSEAVENIIQAVQGLGREKVVEVIDGTDNRKKVVYPSSYRSEDVSDLYKQKAHYPVAVASLDSLVAWIKQARAWLLEHQHGGEETALTSWLFWKEDAVVVVPDVRPIPAMGKVRYDFKATPEARLWGYPRLAFKAEQKGFKELIETTIALGEDLIKLENATAWLDTVGSLQVNQEMKFTSVVDDDRNYKVAMESKEGPKSTKVPRDLTVQFAPLVGFEEMITAQYRVNFRTNTEEPRCTFELVCLNAEQVVREVVSKAVDWVAEKAKEEPHELLLINGGLDNS